MILASDLTLPSPSPSSLASSIPLPPPSRLLEPSPLLLGRPPPPCRVANTQQYFIDCAAPVDDGIMDVARFEKFLLERIKVNGKTGNLGDKVSVTREKTRLVVTAEGQFSKRYLKYLAKKFLKNQLLRDWLHVIASNKSTYELRYFNVQDDNDEDAE